MVTGLNAALWGRQSFVNGSGKTTNFNTSRQLLINEMPQVSVTLIPNPAQLDRARALGGVGELGVPALAPALANAHAKLTGQRKRSLPFFPKSKMMRDE